MYTMGDKLLSRVHYGVLVAVYSVMLLLALVALGTFAKDEAEVRGFAGRTLSRGNCILFVSRNRAGVLELGSAGACGFVLWVQASVLIVVIVWLVYNIVNLILGVQM